MRITDVYNSKAVAIFQSEVASNKIAYLGEGLFPARKKMGLDLKWIRTSKGLPVSLSPSAFDTVSTIRSREGFKMDETEMAYFKESMLVKEQDRQDMLRVQDSSDPYATEVLRHVFDDANTLIDGAKVVPERMRMYLLADANGHPSISIAANGATYAYNYDPDNSYSTNNFTNVGAASSQNYWTDTTNSDPMKDIADAQDKVEQNTGSRPTKMIVSKATMNLLKQNAKIKSAILAQNVSANIFMTDARVKELFANELGIEVIVYTKLYKNESNQAKKFYPDGMATLIPDGALGNTFYGVTPEEATLLEDSNYDCTIIDGIAVTVANSVDPVQTKTIASEIVLPSFERMQETYMLKVASSVTY